MLASVYETKADTLPLSGRVFGLPVERVEQFGYVYDVHNGTAYDPGARREVIEIIDIYKGSDVRLRFHFGDPLTGQDWGDVFGVAGRVGRSTGSLPIPLLIERRGSIGGAAIPTHPVARVRFANRKINGGRDLFRHESYTPPNPENYTPDEYRRHFA